MDPVTISLIVFAFVFGGSLFGIYLRAILPETQLTGESKDLLKLGMGLMATMTALVLGLQLGSAQSSFEAQERNLIEISAKLILLDRALAHYGPETKAVRDLLRKSVAEKLELIWPEHSTRHPNGNQDPRIAIRSITVFRNSHQAATHSAQPKTRL